MVKGVTDGLDARAGDQRRRLPRRGRRADTLTMRSATRTRSCSSCPRASRAKVDKNKVDPHLRPTATSLGQTAAKIRELRPPEPYKGKGVKYAEEVIKRKVGKAGATAAAAASSRSAASEQTETDVMASKSKLESRKKRHRSLRKRIRAPPSVPAWSVFRSAHAHLRPGHRRPDAARRWSPPPTSPKKAAAAAASSTGDQEERARQEGRRGDRQAAAWRRASQGRLRPQRLQVPRPRQGASPTAPAKRGLEF